MSGPQGVRFKGFSLYIQKYRDNIIACKDGSKMTKRMGGKGIDKLKPLRYVTFQDNIIPVTSKLKTKILSLTVY